jgi:hypothetical protein
LGADHWRKRDYELAREGLVLIGILSDFDLNPIAPDDNFRDMSRNEVLARHLIRRQVLPPQRLANERLDLRRAHTRNRPGVLFAALQKRMRGVVALCYR